MPAGRHSSGKRSRAGDKEPPTLNENQARRIRITCRHIDHILCEIESALDEASSQTAFPAYIQDLSADQRQAITVAIPGIRKRLVEVLDQHGIAPEDPQVPVSRAIRGRLYSIEMSVEEIRPKQMKGFGKVPDAASAGLDRIDDDLQQTARVLDRILYKENGMDL